MSGWRIDFPILEFLIALFIGALVGIEREKKQEETHEPAAIGGIRTFILIAEAGAVAGWLSLKLGSAWIFVGAGLMLALILTTGYYMHIRSQAVAPGMTTEVAAIVVYLLGGATLFGFKELAVALAIATSALLAYKQPLHGAVGKLGRDDIAAGLKLLFATFIILPVLPDKAIDPWGALNPYKMWWLVILISSISLVGYIASRYLGPGRGTILTGIFGGLASSTAVALSCARRSRDELDSPDLADALAAGLLISWAVMLARITALVAIVYRPMLGAFALPALSMGLLSILLACFFFQRSARIPSAANDHVVPLRNPFSLTYGVEFGLLFAAVLLVVKLAETYFPGQGLYAVATVAGLTDVDAITLSMAQHAKESGEVHIAVTAITVAAVANTLVKCGLVAVLGKRELRNRIVLATCVILVGAAVAVAFV